MTNFLPPGQLYTFVDTAYLHGRSPGEIARQLCEGGADLIQLRAKNSSPHDIQKMAEEIAPICQQAKVLLVINDHLELAKNVKADFVHLGQEDFFDAGFTHVSQLNGTSGNGFGGGVGTARPHEISDFSPHRDKLSPPLAMVSGSSLKTPSSPLKIGLSTHAPAQAERAIAAGADYIAIGPIYATGTKPTARPVTLDYVRWASKNVKLPWFAIGGITLQNLDAVLDAGAQRVCVVSAILNSSDIVKTCAEFKRRLLTRLA